MGLLTAEAKQGVEMVSRLLGGGIGTDVTGLQTVTNGQQIHTKKQGGIDYASRPAERRLRLKGWWRSGSAPFSAELVFRISLDLAAAHPVLKRLRHEAKE